MQDLRLTVTAEWLAFAETLNADNMDAIAIESARCAQSAGFCGVEFPIPHAHAAIDGLEPGYWRDLARRLKEMEIPVRSVHGPNFPPLDTPLKEALGQIKPWWDITCEMEVEAFVVHPTSHSHPHVTSVAESLLERDVKLCEALIRNAKGPTRLAVENLPSYGLVHLDRLLDRLPADSLGVCFDTGHWNVRPEGTIHDAVTRFGSRIVHMHLSDNPGWCDGHQPPGQGTFPWTEWATSIGSEWHDRPMLIELSVPLLSQDTNAPELAASCWKTAFQQSKSTLMAAFSSAAETVAVSDSDPVVLNRGK